MAQGSNQPDIDPSGENTTGNPDGTTRSIDRIQDYNEWQPDQEIDWINLFIDATDLTAAELITGGVTTRLLYTYGGIYGFRAAQKTNIQNQLNSTGYYGTGVGVLEVTGVGITSQDDFEVSVTGNGWIWKFGYYSVILIVYTGTANPEYYKLADLAPEVLSPRAILKPGDVGLKKNTSFGRDITVGWDEDPTRDASGQYIVEGNSRDVWFDQIGWQGSVETGVLVDGDFSHTMEYMKSTAINAKEKDRIKEKFSYTNTKWSKSIEDMFKDPLGQVTSTSQMVRNSFIKTKVPNRLSLRNFSSLSSETKSQPTTSATGVY